MVVEWGRFWDGRKLSAPRSLGITAEASNQKRLTASDQRPNPHKVGAFHNRSTDRRSAEP